MKPIGQYDLYGNLMRIWDGTEEIHRELGYVPIQSLSRISMSYNGYIFRYMDDIDDITDDYCSKARENKSRLSRKIVQRTDLLTNEIKIYSSLREVIRDGFCRFSVVKCLNGEKDEYKGYMWKYA